jgi:hypothetical protein
VRRALIALASCGVLAAVLPANALKPAPSTTPVYRLYAAPGSLGNKAGEPTLGVDPKSGEVMFQARYETLNVSNLDRGYPGSALWRNTAPAMTSFTTLDPLLKMDQTTGRTFVSQLAAACSLMAYSDDRGESWHDSTLGCGVGSTFDHQSIGVGPYVAGGTLASMPHTYPNVVYYCAQDVVSAKCAPSIDGGDTFLAANVVYTTAQCELGALFGHVKTAPDGTVYLPPRYCPNLVGGGFPVGVAVSSDNSLTWTVHTVPGSGYGDAGHGSVGVATDGTVYLGWGSGTFPGGGPANVAVSRDKGATWTAPVTLGREYGLVNTRFPVTVAGDGDRAVVAFLGTATAGDASAPAFDGVWHLYAAHTYDGGRTWRTYDVTSGNPVQVGPICTAGTTCPDAARNLLDFNDMVVDAKGRVYVAFADGCTKEHCSTNDREQHATFARLVGGRGVYKAFDSRL